MAAKPTISTTEPPITGSPAPCFATAISLVDPLGSMDWASIASCITEINCQREATKHLE